jgi:glycosyl transferase family 25
MQIKGYIIHVKSAKERYNHIIKQIANLSIQFDFVLEGDKEDLTTQIIADNFKDYLAVPCGAASCAYKHFSVLRDMIQNNIPYGLILEDDILLDKTFEKAVFKALEEIKERKIRKFYLSLEDSLLRFVKGSLRKQAQSVYKITRDEYGKDYNTTRCAGAYIIDLQGAKSVIKEIAENKCGLPADIFYEYCVANDIVDLYWLHPTIASQGSQSGSVNSLLADSRRGRISYFLQKKYKQFLWRLR